MTAITEEHLTDELPNGTLDRTYAREPFQQLPEVESDEHGNIMLTSNPTTFNYWVLALLLLPFGCAAGLGVGLVVGWLVWPVQWQVDEYQSAVPSNLTPYYRKQYIEAVSDRYAYDMDGAAVLSSLSEAGVTNDVCELMREAGMVGNAPESVRLYALSYLLGGCNAPPQ